MSVTEKLAFNGTDEITVHARQAGAFFSELTDRTGFNKFTLYVLKHAQIPKRAQHLQLVRLPRPKSGSSISPRRRRRSVVLSTVAVLAIQLDSLGKLRRPGVRRRNDGDTRVLSSSLPEPLRPTAGVATSRGVTCWLR